MVICWASATPQSWKFGTKRGASILKAHSASLARSRARSRASTASTASACGMSAFKCGDSVMKRGQ